MSCRGHRPEQAGRRTAGHSCPKGISVPGRPARCHLPECHEARRPAGPGEFVRGDQLLRIDRKLAIELDGVYRRGEVYRRGFQRISSLLFADRIGRLLTRTLLIPFGGALLLLEGLEHTLGLVIHLIFKVHPDLAPAFMGCPNMPNRFVAGSSPASACGSTTRSGIWLSRPCSSFWRTGRHSA